MAQLNHFVHRDRQIMFHGRFSIVIGSTFQIIILHLRRDGFKLGGRVIYNISRKDMYVSVLALEAGEIKKYIHMYIHI